MINDHPGYSFKRAPWALITGVEPFVIQCSRLYDNVNQS